jgi:Spy/CpxP family protein refolding chaperone
LKKLLAALVAGAFAFSSIGAFAAAHAGAQPAKDDKKGEMKKDDKKGDMKKDDKKADKK